MKKIKLAGLYTAVILLNISCITSREINLAKAIPARTEKHIFSMDGYCVWCNGAIKGDDGKYHLYFSRWPESRGYDAWVTHSEIAHAVSDSLFGPYTFSDVAIGHRGNKYWDGDYEHNPHVIKDGGTYYLYYTGNRGSGYWYNTPDDRKPTPADKEWWVNRNNQRVGVAYAKSPYGPWTRLDHPLIDTIRGRVTTGVPTVCRRADGKYMMVYKSVTDNGTVKGGKVVHHVALADNPLGPFIDYDKPFITSTKSDFPIDDHVEWYQNGKYYCIAKDHSIAAGGNKKTSLTKYGQALILFESDNGLDWHLAKHSLVHKFHLDFTDGTSMDFDRLEMPKIYMENGKVKAIFLAAKEKGIAKSFSVVLPVNE
jgi:hypothetical protein